MVLKTPISALMFLAIVVREVYTHKWRIPQSPHPLLGSKPLQKSLNMRASREAAVFVARVSAEVKALWATMSSARPLPGS